MCDPVTTGIILTGVSGGASLINNQNTLKRQDRQAAAGIRKNAANQREANSRVNEQIDTLGANSGEAETSDALAAFQNALRSARPETEGSVQDVPGASQRFAERVGQGRASVAADGDAQAERLSIIDGILRQRINEGRGISRTGSDINAIGADISAEDFLTRLRVNSERNNPVVDLLAGIGKGVGSGIALKAPKAPVKPPVSGGRQTVFG